MFAVRIVVVPKHLDGSRNLHHRRNNTAMADGWLHWLNTPQLKGTATPIPPYNPDSSTSSVSPRGYGSNTLPLHTYPTDGKQPDRVFVKGDDSDQSRETAREDDEKASGRTERKRKRDNKIGLAITLTVFVIFMALLCYVCFVEPKTARAKYCHSHMDDANKCSSQSLKWADYCGWFPDDKEKCAETATGKEVLRNNGYLSSRSAKEGPKLRCPYAWAPWAERSPVG